MGAAECLSVLHDIPVLQLPARAGRRRLQGNVITLLKVKRSVSVTLADFT